jgi:hypothetical protein
MVFILSKAACGCLLSSRSSLLLSVCLQGVLGCDLCLVHAPLFCLFPHAIMLCAVCLAFSLLLFVSPVNMTRQERNELSQRERFDICFCPIIPRLNLIFAPVFKFEQRVGSVKIASMCFFLAVLLKSCRTFTPATAGYRGLA